MMTSRPARWARLQATRLVVDPPARGLRSQSLRPRPRSSTACSFRGQLIGHFEHPDDAALRGDLHLPVLRQQLIDAAKHPVRIDAPARLNGDILHAVDRVADWNPDDAGVQL